ncbi:uncharacterized protein LOC134793867 [Cydia splendana]|uniref:uncharacterized protein LOC134793867 n=1 Tax=Cydia splendana TaxID=1100963 RepID=UPI00300C77B8
MYSNATYYCSSEIVQHTIDYGTAVQSSVSKRSGDSTVQRFQSCQHLESSTAVGQSVPSLVADKSVSCPSSCPVQYDDTSTYTPSISSGDHSTRTSDEMTSETCSGSACNFTSKKEKKDPKSARVRVVALRRMFVRHWDLIKKSTIRRSRNTSVTPKQTETCCCQLVYNEIGTQINSKATVATATSKVSKRRHFNTLRDAAAATYGLSVVKKKCQSVDTSVSDMKQLGGPTLYHTETQVTGSPFSNKENSTRQPQPQPLFNLTSKWADAVNKMMKNIPSNARKKLTSGTSMTPVQTYSFSTDTRSLHSSFVPTPPSHGLKLISSKTIRDCNTSTPPNMETDNTSLPFCPSDLADKVAEKIIIHISQKPMGYKLEGWPTNEYCVDVATACSVYQLGPEQLSHNSVQLLKTVSQHSSETINIHQCTIPEEDSECHISQSSDQGSRSASAVLSENESHSSNHSSELNIMVLKKDANLRSKTFHLSKQGFLNCCAGQPSEETIRSKSLPKLQLNAEIDPDLMNFQPTKQLNLWPAYSDGSGLARCRAMLKRGTKQDGTVTCNNMLLFEGRKNM